MPIWFADKTIFHHVPCICVIRLINHSLIVSLALPQSVLHFHISLSKESSAKSTAINSDDISAIQSTMCAQERKSGAAHSANKAIIKTSPALCWVPTLVIYGFDSSRGWGPISNMCRVNNSGKDKDISKQKLHVTGWGWRMKRGSLSTVYFPCDIISFQKACSTRFWSQPTGNLR